MQLVVLEDELTVHIEAYSMALMSSFKCVITKRVTYDISHSGSESVHSVVVASPSGIAQVVRAVGIYAEAGSLPSALRVNPLVIMHVIAGAGMNRCPLSSSANESGEPALLPYPYH